MKKDREQELESNLVGDALGSFYKRIEPYSKLILLGVVVIVAGLVAYGIHSSGQAAKRSDATLQLLMNNPEVSSQYPGTVAAAWSLLYQGNENLGLGVRALYQDREEAETLLNQARDLFEDARNASGDSVLVSRANLGVGLASESLGEIDEAIDAYERCIAANESEQMVEVAQDRIDAISLPSNQDFLAWFGEQDFAPADPSTPPELPDASSLPGIPDLDLPDLGLGDVLGTDDAPMEEPTEEPVDVPAGGDFEIPSPGTPDEAGAADETATPDESADPDAPASEEPSAPEGEPESDQ
ncbi:MAG: tetratricopeptide repeat protein [Planctomycetota bacterium]